MIEGYLVLANRIRNELSEIEITVARAEGALMAVEKNPKDQEFYIDSAALNLHDFYAGFERIFRQIAARVDGDVPSGEEWHRDLLSQMNLDFPELRPAVLSKKTIAMLDEYLRFRHVVRNVYTFSLNPELIERLVVQARTTFFQVRDELIIFADFLEKVGQA